MLNLKIFNIHITITYLIILYKRAVAVELYWGFHVGYASLILICIRTVHPHSDAKKIFVYPLPSLWWVQFRDVIMIDRPFLVKDRNYFEKCFI